ncbi:MAG TPA: hypothetical protein VG755_37495 [Nannocystaceae bacterium]|nr:hypothetical protein [Nannocystaceae bacterium]
MAGLPLRWGVVACAGACACGPSVGGTSGGTGSAEGESGSSGLSLSSTAMPGESSEAGSGGAPESSSSSASPESSSTTDDGVDHCSYDTDICGEFSVCVCTCDYDPKCCTCESSECTEDAHCGEEASCIFEAHSTAYCLPVPNCHGLGGAAILESQADVAALAGITCIGYVQADNASLTDLSAAASLMWTSSLDIVNDATLTTLAGFEGLRHVAALDLDGNAVLSDIGALAGLEEIVEGGGIRNNPMLPAADVHALLAGIEGGDLVIVCGNLDDVPC